MRANLPARRLQHGDYKVDAPPSFTDNGDGTISDNNTNLMWEKKDQASSGLHNWNDRYPSTGTNTIFDWVAQLNVEKFAGYGDWRIPSIRQLVSIVDYGRLHPAVDAVFNKNCAPGCTVLPAGFTNVRAEPPAASTRP